MGHSIARGVRSISRNSSLKYVSEQGQHRFVALYRTLYIVILILVMKQAKKRHLNNRGSRERLLAGADRLLRRYGYGGTPLSAVAAESHAPMGSLYFHFPNGKEQLAAEAMRYGSQRVLMALKRALESNSVPSKGLAQCAKAWADDLEESNWKNGCPVAATALEMSTTSELLRLAVVEITQSWTNLIVSYLEHCGCTRQEAAVTAELALALLEGAELLARIQRSRAPLDRAAAAMRSLLPARLRKGDR